jgi:hypothetical protein
MLTFKILTSFALVALVAFHAAGQQQCSNDNKVFWYKTFVENFRGDAKQQKLALNAAESYIAACPADLNDKPREYMQKFMDRLKSNTGGLNPATDSLVLSQTNRTTALQQSRRVQWEYGQLSVYRHLNRDEEAFRWNGPDANFSAGSFDELFKKMGGKTQALTPIEILNLLGQQGWELVSHTTLAFHADGTIRETLTTWTLKRQL